MNPQALIPALALAAAIALPGVAHAQRAPYGAPITLEQAKKVLAAAEAEAKKVVAPVGVTIAVHDSGCNVVLVQRMDNTSLATVQVAQDKSYAACGFRLDTKGVMDRLSKGGEWLFLLGIRGLTPVEGGMPIIVDGKLIGSIGISGGSSQQDAQVAKAGAEALNK